MPADVAPGESKVSGEKLNETPQVNIGEQHLAAHETEVGSSTPSPATPEKVASIATSTSGKLPVVAVDVDEVLGHLVPQLCSFHNDIYGTTLTPEAFTCYDFHEVWGGTREEAEDKMFVFFKSPYFLRDGKGIPVVDGAMEVLHKHVGSLDFHIVTSRQNILEEHTRDWVEANFPGIFTKLHFGNHYSKQGDVRSKPDLCRAIDAVMIIDDNVRYAIQCAEAGIHTCLFDHDDYGAARLNSTLQEIARVTITNVTDGKRVAQR